jgi:hypothetical protein
MHLPLEWVAAASDGRAGDWGFCRESNIGGGHVDLTHMNQKSNCLIFITSSLM